MRSILAIAALLSALTFAAGQSAGSWRVFKHPSGLSIGYPGSWTLNEQEEYSLLTPPNSDPQKEIILLAGSGSQGITDPKDPRVVEALDAIMMQLIPSLKRKAGPTPAKDGSGRGITVLYEGAGPQGTLQARVYTTIAKGYAISVVGLMSPEKLKTREAVLAQIFATLKSGPAQLDTKLVGVWQRVSETYIDAQSSGGRRPGDASLVGNQQVTVTLAADGTMRARQTGKSIASGAGLFVESNTDETHKGTWAAADGKLIIMWDDGSAAQYNYRLTEAGQAVLTGDGKQLTFRRAG